VSRIVLYRWRQRAADFSLVNVREPARRPTPGTELVARVDAHGDPEQEPESSARQELARCLAPLIRQLPEPYRERSR
jgi:hypothetical protein